MPNKLKSFASLKKNEDLRHEGQGRVLALLRSFPRRMSFVNSWRNVDAAVMDPYSTENFAEGVYSI